MQEFRNLLKDAQDLLPANQTRTGQKILEDVGRLRGKLENELELARIMKANYESRRKELEAEEVRREAVNSARLLAMDRLCEKMNDIVENKMDDVVDRFQDDVARKLVAKMDAAIERLESEISEHLERKINAAIDRLGEVRTNIVDRLVNVEKDVGELRTEGRGI